MSGHGHMDFHARTVEAAYKIAYEEAERYQELLNALVTRGGSESWAFDLEVLKLMAKRNAAGRIARLIRYGVDVVGEDGDHLYSTRQK